MKQSTMEGVLVSAVDDKAHIRHELNLSNAAWIRAEPEGVRLEDCVEYAFVPHTDGVTYTAMRQFSEPDGVILVFTPTEWDAFVKGVRDGEFDLPVDDDDAWKPSGILDPYAE